MADLLKIPAKPTHEKLCELVSLSSFLIVAISNRVEDGFFLYPRKTYDYGESAMKTSCLPEQLALNIDQQTILLLPSASGVGFAPDVNTGR